MMRIVVFFAAIFLLFSCDHENAKKDDIIEVSFSHNADPDSIWISKNTIVLDEKAHSGRYVSRTDSTTDCSWGLREVVGKLSDKKLSAVKISAWVKVEALNKIENLCFVVSFTKGNEVAHYLSQNIDKDIIEANTWVNVEKVIVFPSDITPDLKFTGYMLNPSKKCIVLVDDLKFDFYGE